MSNPEENQRGVTDHEFSHFASDILPNGIEYILLIDVAWILPNSITINSMSYLTSWNLFKYFLPQFSMIEVNWVSSQRRTHALSTIPTQLYALLPALVQFKGTLEFITVNQPYW